MVRRIVIAVVMVLGIGFVGGMPARAAINCGSFASQAAAQQHLRDDPSDPDGLDGNPGHNSSDDGVACQSTSYPSGSARDENSVYAQAATTSTTAAAITAATPTTAAVRRTSTATTGPTEVGATAGVGAVLLLAGMSMRGRRAAGAHWSA